ncbi:hypothetical protein G9C85_04585 [Halorubellus sp. JP-L1]|nr:hypothetical protein [Halorubellus sp. JP-L1]NHN40912.1 hypothetical protein [Halorubellus sp. JP-L1]
MGERTKAPDETVQAFECSRCGERLDGPDDDCSDPLCEGDPRSVATGRE